MVYLVIETIANQQRRWERGFAALQRSDDSTVRLSRVADELLLRTLEGFAGRVNSVTFSADGALACGSLDDTVQLW